MSRYPLGGVGPGEGGGDGLDLQAGGSGDRPGSNWEPLPRTLPLATPSLTRQPLLQGRETPDSMSDVVRAWTRGSAIETVTKPLPGAMSSSAT